MVKDGPEQTIGGDVEYEIEDGHFGCVGKLEEDGFIVVQIGVAHQDLENVDGVRRRQLVHLQREQLDEAMGASHQIGQLLLTGNVDHITVVHVERPFHYLLQDVQEAGAVFRIAVVAERDDELDGRCPHRYLGLGRKALQHGQDDQFQQLFVVQPALRDHNRTDHLEYPQPRLGSLLFHVKSKKKKKKIKTGSKIKS